MVTPRIQSYTFILTIPFHLSKFFNLKHPTTQSQNKCMGLHSGQASRVHALVNFHINRTLSKFLLSSGSPKLRKLWSSQCGCGESHAERGR